MRASSASSSDRNSGSVTGTPPARRSPKKRTSMPVLLSSRPAVQEYELLEQMNVLLVLEQRAVQDRDRLLRIVRPQRFRRDVFGDEQLDPVEQLRGRRLLAEPGRLAHAEERRECLREQLLLQVGEVHADYLLHRRRIGETDVVEEATTQECVGQLLLVVARDEDDRPVTRLHELARLVHVELHAIELAQQIVREFDIGLVDLVYEQHGLHRGLECFPETAAQDVIAD